MTQILPDIVTFYLTLVTCEGHRRSNQVTYLVILFDDLFGTATNFDDLLLTESNRNKSVQRNRFGPDPTQLNRDHSRINNGLTGLNQCLQTASTCRDENFFFQSKHPTHKIYLEISRYEQNTISTKQICLTANDAVSMRRASCSNEYFSLLITFMLIRFNAFVH